MTKLHLLPVHTAGAAENMAVDFLLLQRYPDATAPRFRHYDWRGAAFTFGFSQKIEWVKTQLPAEEPLDLCRRPTGGGVVDHRSDWTYALVLPRGHPLYDQPAPHSYRIVHECLAVALQALAQPAIVKMTCDPDAASADSSEKLPAACSRTLTKKLPGVCFQRAELFDVMHAGTGAKIAGAAQKRNKHGLLFQGSIEKKAIDQVNWEDFQARFVAQLASALHVEAVETGWPDFNEDEVSGLIEQYSDPQWIAYR